MKTLYMLCVTMFIAAVQKSEAQNAINPDLSYEAQLILDEGAILDIRYYYYPNLQAYFDTETATYLYLKDGEWVEGKQIPSGIRGYSLHNGQRVAITDYSGDEPYEVFDKHKSSYPPNYSTKRQPPTKGLAYN
ncbi:MAG TPA: hypothetical protein VFQ50_05240 [Flavobacterium sp.]|nr:hypothetical protein [Flavobacterium sp.]